MYLKPKTQNNFGEKLNLVRGYHFCFVSFFTCFFFLFSKTSCSVQTDSNGQSFSFKLARWSIN